MTRICSFMLLELVVLSATVEGISHEKKSTIVANKFLISKWMLWYKSMDINHDGKVSMEDAQENENNFIQIENLDAEKGKMVKKAFSRWWDECVFRWRKEVIFERDFINALIINFNADKERFKKEIGRCFKEVFAAIDINEDKSISKDELLIGMAAFGHPQLSKDNDYFLGYNPNNGLVPLPVVVESWVDFLTSTNASKYNHVRDGFKVDGFE